MDIDKISWQIYNVCVRNFETGYTAKLSIETLLNLQTKRHNIGHCCWISYWLLTAVCVQLMAIARHSISDAGSMEMLVQCNIEGSKRNCQWLYSIVSCFFFFFFTDQHNEITYASCNGIEKQCYKGRWMACFIYIFCIVSYDI